MRTRHGGAAAGTNVDGSGLERTARTAGWLYLAFFVFGIMGSVVVPAQLFVDGDPQGTLSKLMDNEALARVGIALDLAIVVAQALTAVWFYRLFRTVDTVAAGSLALFGMANAMAMLGSAAVLATALEVAEDASLATSGGAAPTVQLLYTVSDNLWGVAGVFFGLWLIPMGWLVLRSRWLPRLLGWLLLGGGVSYVLSAFSLYLLGGSDLIPQLLTIPATVGELWIMGYLVIVGVRHDARASVPSSLPRRTGPARTTT